MTAALAVAGLLGTALAAQAQEQHRRPAHRHMAQAGRDRPLTIGGRRGAFGDHRIIRVSPTEIYAVGGFPYRGPHPNFQQREELRKEARNARIREATSGIYGYGADGLGGAGITSFEEGYNNPNYGNAYSVYTGYNGVPTDLAFGPSFAFRHLTGPEEEDTDEVTWPTPAQLGYATAPPETDSPDE